MSGDHDVCSKCGAGIFACNCDAPTNEPDYVTHNVACCISPEEIAEGKREAYKQGAKDALAEFGRRMEPKSEYLLYRVLNDFTEDILRGEWPMKEKS